MFSLKLTTMLLGFCCLLHSVLAITTTTTEGGVQKASINTTNEPQTLTSSKTSSFDLPVCSSQVSKIPGSLLRPSEVAVFSCQCSKSSGSDKVCPEFNFIAGDEYIFIEERKLDLSPDTCNLEYKLKVRSGLQVGKELVVFTCTLPNSDDVLGVLDVYIDTPATPLREVTSASPEAQHYRTHLSIYMILAIVVIIILTFAFFGLLFRWQINRRRAHRNAMRRSPFVQQQTNNPITGAVNPNFCGDNPPSYNEATLLQMEAASMKKPEIKEQDKKSGDDHTSSVDLKVCQ